MAPSSSIEAAGGVTAAPSTAVGAGAAPGAAAGVGGAAGHGTWGLTTSGHGAADPTFGHGATAELGATAGVGASVGGMDHDVAAAMARHWWYRGRAAAVSSLLRRAGAPRGGRVLDYGCGTGHMGRTLAHFGRVYGADGEPAALEAGHAGGGYAAYAWVGLAGLDALTGAGSEGAGLAGLETRGGAGSEMADRPAAGQLPPGPFTLIACLDVLEHVPDDGGLLRALAALLAPGGLMVVSVPLRPDLFCQIDRRAGHVRRYSPARLTQLFAGAGLEPVAASGYVVALLPAAAAHRRRLRAGRGVAEAEFGTPAAPLNAALSVLAVAEGRLVRHIGLPPGLSQITVLRRVAAAADLRRTAGAAGSAAATTAGTAAAVVAGSAPDSTAGTAPCAGAGAAADTHLPQDGAP